MLMSLQILPVTVLTLESEVSDKTALYRSNLTNTFPASTEA